MTQQTRFILAIAIALVAVPASASPIVGWWRMEVDSDGGGGFSVPNEVTGNPLTGSAGSIEALGGANTITQPPATANTSGLNGSADINGSIAQYAGLNPSSITMEFFTRSNEGDARMILQQSGSTGLRIDQPNDVRIQYSTSSGQVTLDTNINLDANWDHIAFTYDEATGVGTAYLNGLQVATNDGPDGEALTWPVSSLLVGNGMDGGGGFSGNTDPYFDELRILDLAVSPNFFLIGDTDLSVLNQVVPEPASLVLWMMLGLAASVAGWRRFLRGY